LRNELKHALIAAVALSLPGVVQAASRPDAWITMKAKTALYLSKDVTGTAINVDTINGQVTLHGTVRDGKEKARAAELVNAIEGVCDVRDLLRVASRTQNATMMKRSDDLVRSDVQKRLKAARSLDDSSISVKSVDEGIVLLTGRAASFDDNQRALDYAAGQPGVVRVASEIDVPDTLPDEDFRADEETGPEPARRRSAGVTSDLRITSATKMKLAADSRTPATEINVDCHDGAVTLFGMVPSREAKSTAAEIARGVSGARRVVNRIEVVSPANRDRVQARDEDIRQGVETSLNGGDGKENAGIGVEVTNGAVRLTGTVSTWQSNLSAIYLARSVTGVRSVTSELQVETKNAARS
jgi:osmotically-inducible protein OsmY